MPFLGGYLGIDLASTKKLGTNLAPRSLSFDLGTFTNASPRHIRQGTRLIGPFAGGTLATVVVGGKRYAQLESSMSTVNTYSEVFRAAISNWVNANISITDNVTTSPIGATTADFIYPTAVFSTHYIAQTCAFLSGSTYLFSAFVKAKELTKVQLRILTTAFPGTPVCNFDLSSGTIISSGDVDYCGIIALEDSWYCIYIVATADADSDSEVRIYALDADGNTSYTGDGSSGLYLWGANAIKTPVLTSYIPAVAAPVVRAKDQFHWAAADVPAWMRVGFKTSLIMHQGTDEMLASDGGTKYLFHFDATAETISCYFDGADKKIKWAGSVAGALGETVALNWAIDDQIDLEFTFDNGANSTLKVDGGGVDTTYTGTSTAAADGDVYWCMDTAKANQLDIALISEPEPL